MHNSVLYTWLAPTFS